MWAWVKAPFRILTERMYRIKSRSPSRAQSGFASKVNMLSCSTALLFSNLGTEGWKNLPWALQHEEEIESCDLDGTVDQAWELPAAGIPSSPSMTLSNVTLVVSELGVRHGVTSV